eukprot:2907342-Rhodomonas_salina.1
MSLKGLAVSWHMRRASHTPKQHPSTDGPLLWSAKSRSQRSVQACREASSIIPSSMAASCGVAGLFAFCRKASVYGIIADQRILDRHWCALGGLCSVHSHSRAEAGRTTPGAWVIAVTSCLQKRTTWATGCVHSEIWGGKEQRQLLRGSSALDESVHEGPDCRTDDLISDCNALRRVAFGESQSDARIVCHHLEPIGDFLNGQTCH